MDGVGRSSGDSGGHSAGARVDEEGMGMGLSKSESLKPALVVLVSVCPSMKDSMTRAGSRGVSVGSRESNAQGQRVKGDYLFLQSVVGHRGARWSRFNPCQRCIVLSGRCTAI